MSGARQVMILVHPGSACGSADFNLAGDAPPMRDALALEIMRWTGDLLVVDGALSNELEHYALLGLAIRNAQDDTGRRIAREVACDMTVEDWPEVVVARFDDEWPEGPHDVLVTGAWLHDDGTGCVGEVARRMAHHNVTVSEKALRLP